MLLGTLFAQKQLRKKLDVVRILKNPAFILQKIKKHISMLKSQNWANFRAESE